MTPVLCTSFAQASVSGSSLTLVTARRRGMLPSLGMVQARAVEDVDSSRTRSLRKNMQGKLSPQVGIPVLLVIAVTFAANHVSARIAFDHGASVLTGVLARSLFTS